jgi:hypothetical protein
MQPYEPPLILSPAGLIAGSTLLAGCALALCLERTPAKLPHDCLPLRGQWLHRLLRGGLFVGGGVAVVSAPDLLCPAIVLSAFLVFALSMVALIVFGLSLLFAAFIRGLFEALPAAVSRVRPRADSARDCPRG